jgi:hypothetical protein
MNMNKKIPELFSGSIIEKILNYKIGPLIDATEKIKKTKYLRER